MSKKILQSLLMAENQNELIAKILIASIAFKIVENNLPQKYPPMLNPKLKLNRVVDASGIKMSQRNADGFNDWQQYLRQSVG